MRLAHHVAALVTLFAAGTTLLQAAPALAAADTAALQPQREVYRIACDENFAPLSFVDEQGKLQGIDVEILQLAAARAGFAYQLIPLPFDVIVPRLLSGQLDGALGGISVLEQRRQILDFSHPYYSCGLAAVARCDSGIHTLEDLAGKTVIVKRGTLGSMFAENQASTLRFSVKYCDTSPQMVTAVQNGAADFYLEDYPVVSYHLAQGRHPGLMMALPQVSATFDYAFAASRGQHVELISLFNQGLQKLQDDGSIDAILQRYGLRSNPR